MGPAEFDALVAADRNRLELEMFPVLQLTSYLINSNPANVKAKAVSPSDLSPFPQHRGPRRVSGVEFLKHLESIKP